MKRKSLYLCICLATVSVLNACSYETNRIDKSNRGVQAESVKQDIQSNSSQHTAVNAQVQLYEGVYFDERACQYVNMPEAESPLIYYEIMVSNITDTSFDFAIYERTMATDEKSIIFPVSSAVFTGDGTQAAYFGDEQTISFTFPADQAWYPDIRDMKIDGLEQLEGKTYINNNIPGHEAG